jgi:predicted HAD superfamily phosphohydrolase
MPISDGRAKELLKEELDSINSAYKQEWPLEPIKIEKQSDHFWEIFSNFGSEQSIKLLLDAEKGKVLKNSHRIRYDNRGMMTVFVRPV